MKWNANSQKSGGAFETEVPFHLTKNSGLNFLKFAVANETAFSGISERWTSHGKHKLSGMSFREPPKFSIEWSAFLKGNHFRMFRKLSQAIFVPFRNFREVFWLNEKRLEANGTVTVREGLPFTGFSGSSGKSSHILASGSFRKCKLV